MKPTTRPRPKPPALLAPPITMPFLEANGTVARPWYDFLTEVSARLGVTTNRVATVEATAATGAATATAVASGAASTPYTLNPANPIGVIAETATAFTATIVAHIRTEGGTPTSQPAGEIGGLTRGQTYTIFYDAPGAYQASAGVVDFTVAGRRLVGGAYLAPGTNTGASEGVVLA